MDEGGSQDQPQREDDEAMENDGVGPSGINDDNLRDIQCTICGSDLDGEDWGWCHCRSRQLRRMAYREGVALAIFRQVRRTAQAWLEGANRKARMMEMG